MRERGDFPPCIKRQRCGRFTSMVLPGNVAMELTSQGCGITAQHCGHLLVIAERSLLGIPSPASEK